MLVQKSLETYWLHLVYTKHMIFKHDLLKTFFKRTLVRFFCMQLNSFTYFNLNTGQLAKGPWDRGSIPGQVIPKTQKMVLDAALLSTQHYKVKNKNEVQQS